MTGKSQSGHHKGVAAASREQTLDREWVRLIQTAREQGMTIEDIRNFFKEAAATRQQDETSESYKDVI